MRVPLILFFLSIAAMAVLWSTPDLVLLAALSALASAVLCLLAWRKRGKGEPVFRERWIVIDGSNAMYWDHNVPKLETVRRLVAHLVTLGYAPGVMFDANAGYLLGGHYMHDGAMAEGLGLPADRVMVVPKGVPADPYILTAARDLGARIVTNDRYRDWAGDHPEVAEPGHLIRGGVRDGVLWLDLAP